MLYCLTEDKKLFTIDVKNMLSPSPKSCFAFNNFVCNKIDTMFRIQANGVISTGNEAICGITDSICTQDLCSHPKDYRFPKAQTPEILEEFKALVMANVEDTEPYNMHKGKIIAIGDDSLITPQLETRIHWNPVKNCNWACTYCNPEWRTAKNTNKKSPYELKQIFLKAKLPESNNITIKIGGGEPTMLSEIDRIVKWLLEHNDNIKKVIVDTNGSAKWHVLERLCKLAYLQITLHNEYVTPEHLEKMIKLKMAYPKKVKFKIMENANETILDFFKSYSVFVNNPIPQEIDKWWEMTEVSITDSTYTMKRVTV